MFRGRRHIAATIDPDATSDEDDGMEIAPMDIPDEEDSEQTPGNPYLGPDPMMTWKAQARCCRAISVTKAALLRSNKAISYRCLPFPLTA